MTEKAVNNSSDKEEKPLSDQEASATQPKKRRSLGKTGSKKTKKAKTARDFSKSEVILITITGFVTFSGVIFCMIMINLLHSIRY